MAKISFGVMVITRTVDLLRQRQEKCSQHTITLGLEEFRIKEG